MILLTNLQIITKIEKIFYTKFLNIGTRLLVASNIGN